jgi:uncharacterized protein
MKKLAVILFVLLSFIIIGAQEIPSPQGFVNDFAGVLDGGSKSEITSMIEGIEQSTGVEIAVVTLSDLGGAPIEQLAIKYYEGWGIGKKGKDNGVLIIVAITDRKAWIQTGYGIEGQLPDGLVGEIIRNEMLPRFKQGDYGGGIKATVYKVGKIVGGETVSYPKSKRRGNGGGWIYLIFLAMIIISMIGRGKRGGGTGSNLLWFMLGTGLGRGSSGWGGSSGSGSGGFGGFGGFGGGSTGGGGAGGSW